MSWHLWRALKTGVVADEIWFGADKADDYFGYALRVSGLVVMLGVLIEMAIQVPTLFELFGNDA